MINLKHELENFKPMDLNALMEKNRDIPENIRSSILLYNKAIESLRLGSEDIAIIELKKVLSMNPEFHEAMNLLGLCYSYTKEYPKATEMFEKVIAAEGNSVNAMNYLSQINTTEGSLARNENRNKKLSPSIHVQGNKVDTQEGLSTEKMTTAIYNSLKKDYLKYAAGFAAGTLVVFVLGLALNVKPTVADSSKVASNQEEPSKSITEATQQMENKYRLLDEQYKKLQKDAESANTELEIYRNVSKISEVEKLAAEKKYEAAGDKLVLLKAVAFNQADKERFNNLYKDIIPKAAWAVFTEGSNSFVSLRYQEALNKLGKVQLYGTDWAYMDITLYYMGVSYKELNDKKNAMTIFQKLKESYPNSQYTQFADYRVKEMGVAQ